MLRYISGISVLFLMCSAVQAGTLCTLIADAHTQEVIVKKGECGQRVTPASTFKIALSLMGYDAGFLKDATTPTLTYKAVIRTGAARCGYVQPTLTTGLNTLLSGIPKGLLIIWESRGYVITLKPLDLGMQTSREIQANKTVLIEHGSVHH